MRSIIDLSKSIHSNLTDSILAEYSTNNAIDKLIPPNSTQTLHLTKLNIPNLFLSNSSELTSISLTFCPKTITSNQNYLDFALLKNLKNISLKNVQNDILVPNSIHSLELDSSSTQQSKLLNQFLTTTTISLLNFDLPHPTTIQTTEIHLENCTSTSLKLETTTEKLSKFVIFYCEFDVFDVSGANLHEFDENKFAGNEIRRFLLPVSLQHLRIGFVNIDLFEEDDHQNSISEVLFDGNGVKTIEIECCSEVIGCIGGQNSVRGLIDLRQFKSCVGVRLHQICSDLMVPEELEALEVSQSNGDEFKLVNRVIKCRKVNVNNFDLRGILFEGCEVITLRRVVIGEKILDLTRFEGLKDVSLLENEYAVLVPNKLDSLFLYHDIWTYLNQYLYGLLNKQISSRVIIVYGYDLTDLVIESCEQIKLTNVRIRKSVIDLTQITNLKKVTLSNVQNNILLPTYLEKIHLYKGEMENYNIMNTVIYCQDIQIENFNITDLEIKQCNQIVLKCTGVNDSIFDLSNIYDLKDIRLEYVKNDIQLPNSFTHLHIHQQKQYQFHIVNKSINSLSARIQNFDLSGITLSACQVMSLRNCRTNDLTLQQFLDQNRQNLRNCNIINQCMKFDRQALNLTGFDGIQQLDLEDVNISGVIFGPSIEEVDISTTDRSSLEVLDFSQCRSLKTASIENYDIRHVLMLDDNIEFTNCEIMVIDLRNVLQVDIDIEPFFDSYSYCCQYIIKYRGNSKKQMVYKQKTQQFTYVNCTPYILAQQILTINSKIIQLLDE